jgi:UDP-N-acetylmuramate: L-alanyl-gamma-D-glutamyl-meso-diaminopimelate ligase
VRRERLYFIAIGGTAMAPLAVLLKGRGHEVSGSDLCLYPPMSDLIARAGIRVHTGFEAGQVPQDCDTVIIGNAVPRSNPEVQEVLRRGLPYVSMPQAIRRYLLPGRHSVVVAGTHGKTTTAALLAWILTDAGRDPGFLIGGELRNFGSGWRDGRGPHFVLEGDEYNAAFFDRGPKFLHYEPRTLLVNNIEFDHADVYPDLASVEDAFRRLVEIVPDDGVIVANGDDPRVRAAVESARARVVVVSLGIGADVSARDVRSDPEGTSFTPTERGGSLPRMRMALHGTHNLRNALMALGAARSLGVLDEEAARSLVRFQGVKRRLEVVGERRGVTYVDDFAHHPTAVLETLASARRRWPRRRLWAVFEPRSLTAGRRYFQQAYERALSGADAVVLAPVFHAGRFDAAELIDREAIGRALRRGGRTVHLPGTVEEIAPLLDRETAAGDVVILMSSGDFAGLRQRLGG